MKQLRIKNKERAMAPCWSNHEWSVSGKRDRKLSN